VRGLQSTGPTPGGQVPGTAEIGEHVPAAHAGRPASSGCGTHAALVFDGDLVVAWRQFGAVTGEARRQLAEIDRIVPPPALR